MTTLNLIDLTSCKGDVSNINYFDSNAGEALRYLSYFKVASHTAEISGESAYPCHTWNKISIFSSPFQLSLISGSVIRFHIPEYPAGE